MYNIKVTSKELHNNKQEEDSKAPPIVLLHGYINWSIGIFLRTLRLLRYVEGMNSIFEAIFVILPRMSAIMILTVLLIYTQD